MSTSVAASATRPDALVNWCGTPFPIVERDGGWWLRKPAGRREYLGHLLTHGRLNVPEVRLDPVTDERGRSWAWVRIVDGSTPLPIGDLDEAAAAEMVFSLWIRRRDAHAHNRVYVAGIPAFFDHGSAFRRIDLDTFFGEDLDAGYPSRWRVEPTAGNPDTESVRRRTVATGMAVHPIRDLDHFDVQLDRWVGMLAMATPEALSALVAAAGFTGPAVARLTRTLVRSRDELPEAVARLRTTVFG